MDTVVPFVLGVNDGNNVRAIQLLGQDERFDVVDVTRLVSCRKDINQSC